MNTTEIAEVAQQITDAKAMIKIFRETDVCCIEITSPQKAQFLHIDNSTINEMVPILERYQVRLERKLKSLVNPGGPANR